MSDFDVNKSPELVPEPGGKIATQVPPSGVPTTVPTTEGLAPNYGAPALSPVTPTGGEGKASPPLASTQDLNLKENAASTPGASDRHDPSLGERIHKWIIIHLNPKGYPFATRVEAGSEDEAKGMITDAHDGAEVVDSLPDHGSNTHGYGGTKLPVVDLDREP